MYDDAIYAYQQEQYAEGQDRKEQRKEKKKRKGEVDDG